MLMSVKRLLRTNGYDSLLFSSAKAFKNQVDFEDACCVVLDINLEDGSGIELRYGLKAAGNSVPVIYMTGNDNPGVRKAALESGCLAYLTKPFSAKALIKIYFSEILRVVRFSTFATISARNGHAECVA